MMNPAMIAGRARGKAIEKNARTPLAPSSRAACSISVSIVSKALYMKINASG